MEKGNNQVAVEISPPDKNIFTMGDLHGRYDLFVNAVYFILKSAPSGKIVFLGDYVDRGPDSYSILRTLRKGPPDGWEWVILKGNHEFMMHDDDPFFYPHWCNGEGVKTIESFERAGCLDQLDDYRSWVKQLPSYHIDGKYIFAHADWDEYQPAENQTDEVLLWRRRPTKESAFFSKNGEILVHGHTVVESGPKIAPNRINLDVRAYATGRIVVARLFENKQEFYEIIA